MTTVSGWGIISKSPRITVGTRKHSSAGRALALQARGHRFEPYCFHHSGPVVQLVRTLACHARGRRFEPDPGRHICGFSSSGRAPPCQGGGSEFKPRNPLHQFRRGNTCGDFYLRFSNRNSKSARCGRSCCKKWFIQLGDGVNHSEERLTIAGFLLRNYIITYFRLCQGCFENL